MSALDGGALERFVVDRQISAGWMHSGYPVMAHLASSEEVLSLTSLQANGAWGPFHELGHNHQVDDWGDTWGRYRSYYDPNRPSTDDD